MTPRQAVYTEARRCYAPDSAFALFLFQGEACGAYCIQTHDTYIRMRSDVDPKPLQNAWEIKGSDADIVQIEPNTYLVQTEFGSRVRGIESVLCRSATLITLTDTAEITWHFESCTSNLASENEEIYELDYHPETHAITYRFAWYEETEDWPIYIESGSWEYVNGTFRELSPAKKEYIESR